MNLSNDCYNIISLLTCILNTTNEDLDWRFESIEHIEFTDKLKAIVKYEYICSDEMSLRDYEDHFFSIEFFVDGNFLGYFAYERILNNKNIGFIANPELSPKTKLELLNAIKPGIKERFKALSLYSKLTPEEIELIHLKSEELSSLALEKSQNKSY